jgi:hypothetical protein
MNRSYPEMEFLNGILVEVFGLKLDSFQTRVFVWFSTPIFPFYKCYHEKTRVFLLRGFFVRIFKTRVDYGFI